jgi:hypothetical protein
MAGGAGTLFIGYNPTYLSLNTKHVQRQEFIKSFQFVTPRSSFSSFLYRIKQDHPSSMGRTVDGGE